MGNTLEFVLGCDGAPMGAAVKRSIAEMDGFTNAVVKAGKKADETFKEIGISHKELHAGFRLAGEAAAQFGGQVGGLAGLGHFIFNPWFLVIGGLIEAFHMLADQAEAANQRIGAVISVQTSHSEHAYSALAETIDEANAKFNAFHRALASQRAGQDPESETMRTSIDLFNQQMESLKAVNEAKEKGTEQAIEYAQAIGRISEAQAMQFKFEVQNKKVADDSAASQKALANEIAAKAKRQRQAALNVEGYGGAVEYQIGQSLANEQAIKTQQSNLTDEKSVLDNLRKARDEAAAKRIRGGVINEIYALPGGGTRAVAGDLEQQYQIQLTTVQKQEESLRLKQEQAKADADALEDSKRKVMLNDQLNHQLGVELGQLRGKQELQKKADAEKLAAVKQQQKLELAMISAKFMGQVAQNFGATSVEKMGFHFNSGGPSLLSDHAQETARNTGRTATAIEQLLRAVLGPSGLTGSDLRILGATQ